MSRIPSSAALEQGGAEVAFELLDLLRHGRRRVAELIGRCDDGARPRDCRECAQALQVDHEAMLRDQVNDSELVLHGMVLQSEVAPDTSPSPCSSP